MVMVFTITACKSFLIKLGHSAQCLLCFFSVIFVVKIEKAYNKPFNTTQTFSAKILSPSAVGCMPSA